jgi:hypothetical protein
MKFALALMTASAFLAACATSTPTKSQLSTASCSIQFIQSFGVYLSAHSGERGYVQDRSVPTKGSERYCEQIRDENARYADRARTQMRTNAVYPDPMPLPPS